MFILEKFIMKVYSAINLMILIINISISFHIFGETLKCLIL